MRSLIQREMVDGAQLRLNDDRSATTLGDQVAMFDLSLATMNPGALAWAPAQRASQLWCQAAPTWLQVLGYAL